MKWPGMLFIFLMLGTSYIRLAAATCTYKVKDGQSTVRCRKENHFPDSISSNVTEIDLSGCVLKTVHRKLLRPFSQLHTLLVHRCHIETMDLDTFDDSLNLQTLDLSKNPSLNSTVMIGVLCRLAQVNLNLTDLDLAEMKLGLKEFTELLPCLERMHLSVLDLSSNNLSPLKDNTFSGMQSLVDLKVGNIPHLNIRAFANLTRLNTLRLQNNKLKEIPNFCDGSSNEPLFPNLTALYLDFNYIQRLPGTSVGLDKLKFLNLRGNDVRNISAKELSILSPKLNTLFLNTNRHFRLDQSSFSTSLKRLELRDCKLYFNRRVRYVFHNLTSMEGLSVSVNYFDTKNDDVLSVLFHGMSKLEYLSAEHSRIKRIPDTTFYGLFNLKELTLNDNKLSYLSPGIFRDLRSLNKLSLAGNSFSMVDQTMFENLIPPISILDFSRNPFVCDCSLLWFVKLIRSNNIRFTYLDVEGAYKCNSPQQLRGVNLKSLNFTTADCRHLPGDIKLTITLSSLLVAILLIVTVVYRLRWYIGYAYFVLRAKRREARECDDSVLYEYDAFVIYNRNDLEWVRDRLLPVLEEEAHLRLCVHDRDWLCGRDIWDNIVQSIANSRKTLLIVSNAFATSQWCHLEMTLAQHRLLSADRNALVLVLLERLETKNLTPRLLLQMRQQTYLEWSDNPDRQKLFWKKLRRSLQRPAASFIRGSSARVTAPRFAEDGTEVLIHNAGTEMHLFTDDGINC